MCLDISWATREQRQAIIRAYRDEQYGQAEQLYYEAWDQHIQAVRFTSAFSELPHREIRLAA